MNQGIPVLRIVSRMIRHFPVLLFLLTLLFHISSASWSPCSLRTIPEDSALDSFSSDSDYSEHDEDRFKEDLQGVSPVMDLLESCQIGNLRDLEISLVHDHLNTMDLMEALSEACFFGQLKAVKLILEDTRVVPGLDRNACLNSAIEGDHPDVVRVLLNDGRIDLAVDNYYVVRNAHLSGRTEILRLFLGHPGTNLVDALQALKPQISPDY